MNIIYKRLFELSIRHEFFANGKGRNLNLIPTKETQNLFKSGRMLFRDTPNGTLVLYRAKNDLVSPEIDLPRPKTFSFLLQSDDQAFIQTVSDFDKLPRKFSSGDFLHFQNLPAQASTDSSNPESLEHEILDGRRSMRFSSEVILNPIPGTVILQVLDSDGNKISSGKDFNGQALPVDRIIQAEPDGKVRFEINLSGKKEGVYTIQLRNDSDTTTLWTRDFFLSADPNLSNSLGVVQIRYSSSPDHLYGLQEFYRLQLNRKTSKWTYYIVNQNKRIDLSSSTLIIEDRENPPSSPYSQYQFDQLGSTPHPEIRINDHETVIFRSQVPIPYFERPKLNLELRRNPGNRVLFSHLPNPLRHSPVKTDGGDPISEIYVYI